MSAPGQGRPPFPPFTRETAAQKARAAEDAWNSRDPERVSLAYTVDSAWRNRADCFPAGRWARELEYRLIQENREFDEPGSVIKEEEQRFRWPLGRRPDDHDGLSALSL